MSEFVNKRLVSLMCLMSSVIVVGTAGYSLIEHWPLMDGLYMTLITISTVGYGEINDLTHHGRVFTSFLIIFSMISLVYWTAGITSLLVSGDLSGDFQKRRMLKMISNMRDHVVVCGGGVMAQTVIMGLIQKQLDVVVITDQEEQIRQLKRAFPMVNLISGDPKCELTLADANVLNANVLVAALESDYDNLLITITGAGLGTDIRIYSCAMTNQLAAKMLKVGASEVICPMVLCGQHVTSLICESTPSEAAPVANV